MIECENSAAALICEQCKIDLEFADQVRKECLRADDYFRSTIRKEFFKSELNEQLFVNPLCEMIVKEEITEDPIKAIKLEVLYPEQLGSSSDLDRNHDEFSPESSFSLGNQIAGKNNENKTETKTEAVKKRVRR